MTVVIRKKVRSTRKKQKLVTHLRLPEIDRPKWADGLRFPDDVTELTAANVSELLGKYTQLWTYVQQDLSRLEQETLKLDSAERERKHEIITGNPRINTIEKHKREAFYDGDSKMRGINRARSVIDLRKASSHSFLSIYDKYIQALSRELTRKGMTEERGMKYAPR